MPLAAHHMPLPKSVTHLSHWVAPCFPGKNIYKIVFIASAISTGSYYFIQTARTCFKSVSPISTFSMPSIFRVRMPLATQAVNSVTTLARS